MIRLRMKLKGLLLIAIIIVSSFLILYSSNSTSNSEAKDTFYFGVSYGQVTAEEALPLIDKVKDYTNVFIVNSWNVTANETALNIVCDYAAQANLKLIVYFDFISRVMFPWHQKWLDNAKQRWGDKFLGVYLRDEPGGRQIEYNELFNNASDYSDAANKFIQSIQSSNSNIDAKSRGIPMFTADYALYWWDYLAGYDTVFAELGWNISTNRQIALCRGAANMQGKDWGAIITWKYDDPPYLGSGQEIYQDMVSAYRAGAKYVVIFNYPKYPENNTYGILSDEVFSAMKRFWDYSHVYSWATYGKVAAQVALVLPKDYAWAMRRSDYIDADKIWGLWPEDEKAPLILNNTDKLDERYYLKLDIIYDDPRFNYKGKYSQIYFWNSTIP
jgi:hypothetical protein